PECGGVLDASKPGYITSPGYPLEYPPHQNCHWIIQAPEPSQRIVLNFNPHFEIERLDCKKQNLNISCHISTPPCKHQQQKPDSSLLEHFKASSRRTTLQLIRSFSQPKGMQDGDCFIAIVFSYFNTRLEASACPLTHTPTQTPFFLCVCTEDELLSIGDLCATSWNVFNYASERGRQRALARQALIHVFIRAWGEAERTGQ
ncbi:hypothetical protein XENOCAPTIV_000754, partial [Xenoophorus captivus]